MTKKSIILTLLLSLALNLFVKAQDLTQTIRGKVFDKVSNTELIGATVLIVGTNPLLGSVTNMDGEFKIEKVPVGSYTIRITYIGYQELIISNVVVNSGKEVVLDISLEEDIIKMEELVIKPEVDKEKPLNELALVSARTFSVEETRNFAAAVNDPARMVSSFAGVVQTDDGNNTISIRGNAPFGLQWRMEGVEIPNPNHYGRVGSSGGGISMLSSQLLANSDFLTSAFPAEYGNALAGVFDLKLRKGNNEKREYTLQAGLLGIDVAAEGPFAENYNGSFLVNYRYSTLSLLSKLGIPIGDAVTDFQDLSYNVSLPAGKVGAFSLFGFGGLSDQNFKAARDSTQWKQSWERYDSKYHTYTGMSGFKHMITLTDKTFIQSSIVISGLSNGYKEARLDDTYVGEKRYSDNFIEKKVFHNVVVNHKFNARNSIRSGFYATDIFYNFNQVIRNNTTGIQETTIDSKGSTETLQIFSQWNYKFSNTMTLNLGIHYLRLALNKTWSLEPRASFQYKLNEKNAFSLGYGLHSQIQPLGVYFAEVTKGSTIELANKTLGLSKAHHFVFSYDWSINNYMRVKTETYYQHLFNIPVSVDPASTISSINSEGNFITDELVNDGIGRNYGIELTFEHFMHNNLYYLFSSSIYDAKYKAKDGVWRNTRFNGNFAFSFTAGKEFPILRNGKNRVLGVNIKTLYSGGLRETPIDYVQSQAEGKTIFQEDLAFSEKLPNYFRTDFRISWKRNRPKSTSIVSLDIQNVTNRSNLGGQYYDAEAGEIQKWYQTPLIPVLSYRLEF